MRFFWRSLQEGFNLTLLKPHCEASQKHADDGSEKPKVAMAAVAMAA